jgi:hypothetical protein
MVSDIYITHLVVPLAVAHDCDHGVPIQDWPYPHKAGSDVVDMKVMMCE